MKTSGTPPRKRAYTAGVYWPTANLIIVYGGVAKDKKQPFDDLHVLDLDTLTWSQPATTGDGPGPRCYHTMVLLGATESPMLYVFGGWNGRRRSKALHALDPTTWTWSALSEAQSDVDPHSSHDACAVDERTMVVVGRGETGTHKRYGCNVSVLDVQSLSWSVSAGVVISRAGHSVCYSPVADRLMLYGGRERKALEFIAAKHSARAAAVRTLDDDGQALKARASKCKTPPGRSYHASTRVGDDLCLIHGGFIEGKSVRGLIDATNEAYICEMSSGKWWKLHSASDLPRRAAHVLVHVGHGRAVLFGGTHASSFSNRTFLLTWDA